MRPLVVKRGALSLCRSGCPALRDPRRGPLRNLFPIAVVAKANQVCRMPNARFDLQARAHQAMVDAGFRPDFPPEVLGEVQTLRQSTRQPQGVSDLRSLLWSSIDNDTSRDLDQVEYVESLSDAAVRLLVGIADVDSFVSKDSATDRHATAEATSVYTGVATFPMLPPDLSTGLTSLLDAQDRLSIMIELLVQASGEVTEQSVYPAWLRNRAKLDYMSTGAWLEGRGPMPPAIADVPGMEAQLRLQQITSDKLRRLRKEHGALTFASSEATTVLAEGEVKDLQVRRHNVAEDIIESFMVAANVAMA